MNNTQEITPAQIEAWKKEHGRIFVAQADGKKGYYRKPTRKDLSYAMTLQDKPLEMSATLLRQCFLGGHPLHEDTECLLGCDKLVEQLIQVKQVEVGEL